MTGRMIGFFAQDGSVLAHSFEYLGADNPAVVGGGLADPEPWAADR